MLGQISVGQFMANVNLKVYQSNPIFFSYSSPSSVADILVKPINSILTNNGGFARKLQNRPRNQQW